MRAGAAGGGRGVRGGGGGTTMNNRFTFFAALMPILFARDLIQHAESNQGDSAREGSDLKTRLNHISNREM